MEQWRRLPIQALVLATPAPMFWSITKAFFQLWQLIFISYTGFAKKLPLWISLKTNPYGIVGSVWATLHHWGLLRNVSVQNGPN